jgi:hypothetical protein
MKLMDSDKPSNLLQYVIIYDRKRSYGWSLP